MATHGQPHPIDDRPQPDTTAGETPLATNSGSRASSTTCIENEHHTNAALNNGRGRRIDPEKGRDLYIVDWYGPDDPEARRTPDPM